MVREVKYEISMRHIPDISDTSLSFQIPENSQADFLLGDSTNDFDSPFLPSAGDNDSFAALPHPNRLPLTLSQLTPKPKSKLPPPSRSSSPSQSPSPSPKLAKDAIPSDLPCPGASSNSNVASELACPSSGPTSEHAMSEERFENLRAEVETLSKVSKNGDQVDPGPDHKRGQMLKPRPKPPVYTNPKLRSRIVSKHTVADGGITKSTIRGNLPASTLSRNSNTVSSHSQSHFPSPSSVSQQPNDVTEEIALPHNLNHELGDISVSSIASTSSRLSTGGVAERLVSYSQKLISSFGLYRSRSDMASSEDTSAGKTEVAISPHSSPMTTASPSSPSATGGTDSHDQFRLSEISPRKGQQGDYHTKRMARHDDAKSNPKPPLGTSNKRAGADDDEDAFSRDHVRKKGKMVFPTDLAETKRGSSDMEIPTNTQVLQPSTNHNASADHGSLIRTARLPPLHLPQARTKYRPNANCQKRGASRPAVTRSTSSCPDNGQVLGTIASGGACRGVERKAGLGNGSATKYAGRSRFFSSHPEARGKGVSSRAHERPGPSSRAGVMPMFEKPTVTLPPTNPTKPTAFTFRVDARMEARRTEFEQKLAVTEEKRAAKVHAQPLPVPDFKALHIAQEASLACRKEQIVPILPAGQIEFSTEQRAKERERFDEMMKRKEEEMERLREERRKQQEIELEREIKELRKKAVPKAHEVPEWYGDMPKRKGGGVKG